MSPPKIPSVVVRGLEPEAAVSSIARDRPSQPPWSRILLGLAIAGPALWLGGVPSIVVPGFCAVVLALWIRLCTRSEQPLRVPSGAFIGLFAAGLTLLQWMPLPLFVRELVAPGLTARVAAALTGSGATAWPGLSPVPGDSALEAARLLALTGLFVGAAQLSWRVSAGLVALAGSLVALIGLTQAAFGVEAIYGLYQPLQVDPTITPALLTTFVNANHQAGLFLLGIFSAGALAVHMRLQGRTTTDAALVGRLRERRLAALGALAIQGAALLLSLSRAAIVALAVVAPVALMLAWRNGPVPAGRSKSRDPQGRLWLQRGALAAGLGLLALVVARQGAWAELSTLWRVNEAETKFRIASDAVALIDLSPVLGVGRGAFLDLFPAVDSRPLGVVHTHLESAPAAMLIEWGPLGGGLVALGLLWWWIAAVYSTGSGRHVSARRVALCGPLALAIHNLADFNLEFLGVAAPLCALAGALSERRGFFRAPARPAILVGGLSLAGAAALALWAQPYTWQNRAAGDAAVLSGDMSPEAAQRMRPLDASLHILLAQRALEIEDWAQARARATVASELQPANSDAWLRRAHAARELGDAAESASSLARTLATMRHPPDLDLTRYLLGRYPNAEELAPLMPKELAPWTVVMESLIAEAPAYAAILAAARSQVDGREPPVLHMQVRLALALDNPSLALHYARLLRMLAPHEVHSHLLLARALESQRVPRERELQGDLEEALAQNLVTEPAQIALIEEKLLGSYLRDGQPDALARARDLLPRLLARPGDRAALQRRHALERALAQAGR
ncbi:hypothetical protein [Nannocystis pusilla]|uniref:tetratricopeptide repeat protein n=1 Tax=Nannocystis pusilla TaxID=889268 RepID=UPI003DA46D79